MFTRRSLVAGTAATALAAGIPALPAEAQEKEKAHPLKPATCQSLVGLLANPAAIRATVDTSLGSWGVGTTLKVAGLGPSLRHLADVGDALAQLPPEKLKPLAQAGTAIQANECSLTLTHLSTVLTHIQAQNVGLDLNHIWKLLDWMGYSRNFTFTSAEFRAMLNAVQAPTPAR